VPTTSLSSHQPWTPTVTAIDLERMVHLWAMTRAERVAAARRGELTLGQMLQ
jgi:hypothetical protein